MICVIYSRISRQLPSKQLSSVLQSHKNSLPMVKRSRQFTLAENIVVNSLEVLRLKFLRIKMILNVLDVYRICNINDPLAHIESSTKILIALISLLQPMDMEEIILVKKNC